jgi:integrase/recombinase XerD
MEASISMIERPRHLDTREARNDGQVVEMWLHGRSEHTVGAYRADVERLLSFVGSGVGLRQVSLKDLQDFADYLRELPTREGTRRADGSVSRALSSVKSLLKFAHRLGYTPYDVGTALRLPKLKNKLAERILTEEQVMRIITLETDLRNAVLLRLLYASAGRVSEISGLTWNDLQDRTTGGQVTLYGKGGKTRVVLLTADTWAALQTLRGSAGPDDPVFRSRKYGGHINPAHIFRIVRNAARRAGVDGNVSPHWFRHSHASHALDRHAPVHVVQATLGHASLATTSRYVHARPTESSALYLPM